MMIKTKQNEKLKYKKINGYILCLLANLYATKISKDIIKGMSFFEIIRIKHDETSKDGF